MIQENSFSSYKHYWLWGGLVFLGIFWWFGYDGITFSDDVIYLKTGQDFWEGKPLDSTHHFSSRIGSFIFSGLFTYLFGFSDRVGSIASLGSYVIIMLLTYKLLHRSQFSWSLIFLITQIYFLHFLTKVYPDSLLALWVFLIPFAASFRLSHPLYSAFGIVFALFMGFLTKETIVFLFPFPFLLMYLDWKNGAIGKFHRSFLVFSLLFGTAYLAYYWIFYDNPFFRIQAVHAGHYISEYTFFDKSLGTLIWRVTLDPLVTFVHRGYWLWLILSLPAIVNGLKKYSQIKTSFAYAIICLILGFWWMSTSLEYYNPIHLNPRHLIILIPICAVLTGLGSSLWMTNSMIRNRLVIGVLIGAIIGFVTKDWKQAVFLCTIGLFLWSASYWKEGIFKLLLLCILLIATILSVRYQFQLKNYQYFLNTLSSELANNENQFVLVNEFVDFSKEVLLPNQPKAIQRIKPISVFSDGNQILPDDFSVLIYNYYWHAYPKEAPDVENLFELIQKGNFEVTQITTDQWIRVIKVRKLP